MKINAIMEQNGASMAQPVRKLHVEAVPELAGLVSSADAAGHTGETKN